jgi:hypothetical protein
MNQTYEPRIEIKNPKNKMKRKRKLGGIAL